MSLDYAEGRIKEALKNAKGNPVKARQQIIAWAFEDAKLLYALAKPHLSGIVAYNIERVASGRAEKVAPAPEQTKKEAPVQKPKKEEAFGLELLKAVAGSSQIFGLEDAGAPRSSGHVSQAHIDAIRALAAKQENED